MTTIRETVTESYFFDDAIPCGALTFPRPDMPDMARLALGEAVLYIDDYDEDGNPDPRFTTWTIRDRHGELLEHDGGTTADGEARVKRFIQEWKDGNR